MRFFLLVFSTILISQTLKAAVPEKEILEAFQKRFEVLMTPEAFKKMVTENPDKFPTITKEEPLHTIAFAEPLVINGETFTLQVAYRQGYVKTQKDSKKVEFIKKLWSTPEFFQKLYFLDGPSKVEGSNDTATEFKGRVFKKVPGIEDQDYVLSYDMSIKKNWVFLRAKLDKDNKGFALRDNLRALEILDDHMVFREISIIYPLRWYVRALGPTARSTMRKELHKQSHIEKCLTEGAESFPPSEEALNECSKGLKK